MEIVKKERTFLEKLFFKNAEKIVSYYNPLNLELNSIVTIDLPDYGNMNFRVMEVQEYHRNLNDKNYIFTDYVLISVSKNKTIIKIRVNPIEDAVEEDGYDYLTMILFYDHESPYSKELYEVFRDCEKEKRFTINLEGKEDGLKDGEKLDIVYDRCEGLEQYIDAKVYILKDNNKNNQFDEKEISSKSIMYGDFVREIDNEIYDSEFYFVEMNNKNGSFEMLRGNIVNPSTIKII